MKNRVQYKKEPKIEICYQGVITTQLVTCNLHRVQCLKSLTMQIQWECSVQVKVDNQSENCIVGWGCKGGAGWLCCIEWWKPVWHGAGLCVYK